MILAAAAIGFLLDRFLAFQDKVLPSSPGWPQTQDPPALAFQVLGFILLSFLLCFFAVLGIEPGVLHMPGKALHLSYAPNLLFLLFSR
jgi:hypothetical protein